MRLTVHVTDAAKHTATKKTKDGEKKFTRLMTTLSFNGVKESDLSGILNSIEENNQGKPVKHYFSEEKIPGMARKKK